MTPSAAHDPAAPRSPLPGCLIFVLGILVLAFLGSFSVWTLFRQYEEISKFTAEKPVPVAVVSLEGKEAQINALARKIEVFRQSLADSKDDASLSLAPDEINLAIAAYEPLNELRRTFHVVAAEGDTITAAISFKLNGKPRLARGDEPGLTGSDPRFLNATLTARPKVVNHELVLEILAIEVPGVTVPPEFIGYFSPYRIADSQSKHPEIGPAMAKLTAAAVADGRVALRRNANEKPAGDISTSQVNAARNRFFAMVGIGASVFLAFVGIILFIGFRAKARKSRF